MLIRLQAGLLRFVLTVVVIIFLQHALGYAETIKFLTHSVGEQVYFDENGYLRGKPNAGRRAFNIELVREMMLLMGQEPLFEVVPFKRGLQMVQSNSGYALFNVNRTKSREENLQWVGPLQSSITHLYENKHAPTGLQSLDDARLVDSICVLRGNVHHRFFEKKGFKNVFAANSYANCIDMLELKRASLTPLSNLSTVVMESGSRGGFLQKTPVQLMQAKGYLVFSKETPFELVKIWQEAYEKLNQSGRYEELMNKYMYPANQISE